MFTGLDGYVRYREYAQDQAVDRGQLPTPVFDANSSYNLNPTNWSEFWIDFEQRVPSELAASMSAAFAEKRTVQLDLSALNIGISLLNQTGDKARLPVWDGVLVQQLEDKVFIGKVINVSAAATLKVTD